MAALPCPPGILISKSRGMGWIFTHPFPKKDFGHTVSVFLPAVFLPQRQNYHQLQEMNPLKIKYLMLQAEKANSEGVILRECISVLLFRMNL